MTNRAPIDPDRARGEAPEREHGEARGIGPHGEGSGSDGRSGGGGHGGGSGEDDGLPGFDQLIGTFMQEPSLWPVLAVGLGSGGAFAATLMILAGVDRNPFAAAALLLVLGMTIDVALRARKRPSYRNGARLLALIWLAGLVLSGVALWSGIAYAR